jgi:hypothetical protein
VEGQKAREETGEREFLKVYGQWILLFLQLYLIYILQIWM